MRNLSILILSLASLSWLNAQPVGPESARHVAEHFYAGSSREGLKSGAVQTKMQLLHTRMKDEVPVYYIFNSVDMDGFVMVAADYRCYPVIGFSHNGPFYIEDMPPALEYHLDAYIKSTEGYLKNNKKAGTGHRRLWNELEGGPSDLLSCPFETVGRVDPLLRTTWDQDCYYNSLCPEVAAGPCGHVRVGCVAVAMAQVMKYWEYPRKGTGKAVHVHNTFGRMEVDFDTVVYNWGNMPDKLFEENTDVARILYHCGIAVRMDYSASFSGAGGWGDAMRTYFGYSHNIDYVSVYSSDSVHFGNVVRNELDNLRPVIGSGRIGDGDIGTLHAYVIDGYYGKQHLHYNWGWNGKDDGCFIFRFGSATIGIQSEDCSQDNIRPNLVENLTYAILDEEILVAWDKPAPASDGDRAQKYKIIKDNTHNLYTDNQHFRFRWDTIGTYRILVYSHDDCLNRSDAYAELEIVLPENENYSPRITGSEPPFADTISVYQGALKTFEVRTADPNHDSLSYFWTFASGLLEVENSPRLVHNFSSSEPGFYPLNIIVSDESLWEDRTWILKIHSPEETIIDDYDNLEFIGDWYERVNTGCQGGSFHQAPRNVYFPNTAEYRFFPPLDGAYKLSVFIPETKNLTTKARYEIFNGLDTNTCYVNQADSSECWVLVDTFRFSTGDEVKIKMTDMDRKSNPCFMAVDAIKFEWYDITGFRGANQRILPEILAHPNPARGSFNIRLSESGYGTCPMILFDLTGKMVYSSIEDTGGEIVLHRNGLPAGLYILEFRTPAGPLMKKLIFR